ncbi:MAG: helix-turn-helix domain-containing protein [Rubrobacter sp.]
MLIRVLAALGVGVWCIFLLLFSVGFIVDRGLADVGIAWLGVLSIGVAAPVLLLWQTNRAIATHEESRRAASDTKEKELLVALEEHGVLTPATAAMRTSLTVDEASRMLMQLARKGHLQPRTESGVVAYALAERERPGLPGNAPAYPEVESEDEGALQRLEDPLSERELEVLGLLASGKTNSEVARELFVSVGTVKSHTGNIYRKLGAKNRAEALARARELKLLT